MSPQRIREYAASLRPATPSPRVPRKTYLPAGGGSTRRAADESDLTDFCRLAKRHRKSLN